jgi:arylsulfatase A-like enzyme
MYGDFLMMVDHEIGRVLAALDAAGMSKDTLLVFTSDNGPVWYQQDVERFGHRSVAGLRGMKGDAWEGGHRMPFIVRWPGRVAAGSTSDQTICSTDLMATFAGAVGVELPAAAGPDSFSLLPVLEGRQPADQPVRGPLVMRSGSSGARVIRDGDWKLIDRPGSGGFSKSPEPQPGDPPGQLYNLRDDPAERDNLYQKQPDRVARLMRLMTAIMEAPASRSD